MTFTTIIPTRHGDDVPLPLRGPGEVFAAVPALLGYYPTRSILIPALNGPNHTELTAVLRHDLAAPTTTDEPEATVSPAASAIDGFVAYFRHCADAAAVILLVDDAAPARVTIHREMVATLHSRLAGIGTEVVGAFSTAEIAHGQQWWDIADPGHCGRIPDPDSSLVATAQVYTGRHILRSRAELQQRVAPDVEVQSQVCRLIAAAGDSADLEYSLGVDNLDRYRRAVARVIGYITHLACGESLLPVELAEIAVALTDDRVRDALLGLVITDRADAAERLWLLLTRSLPAPHRADAATLLAFSAYLRGDGSLARIALDVAHAAAPPHRLANLLDHALTVGIPPQRMRTLAEAALAAGRDGYACLT